MCASFTFDVVHQGDDLLGEGPRVHFGLPVCPRVLQHGQEVQTLATDIDQVEGQLPVRRVAVQATGEEDQRRQPAGNSIISRQLKTEEQRCSFLLLSLNFFYSHDGLQSQLNSY